MSEIQSSSDYKESVSSKSIAVAWNFFWIGFVIYTVAFSFPGINMSLKYLQAGQIVGIILFLPSGIYLVRWSFENVYLKIVFLLYVLWSFIVILRGFSLDLFFLKSILFYAAFSIFIYLVPFILVFKGTLQNLRKLFSVIIILNLVYLFYLILYKDLIISGITGFYRLPTEVTERITHFLSLPTAFILMTYLYHKQKKIFFSLFILVITFLVVTIRARRGLMFMTLCFMVFSYLIFYFTNKGKILKIIVSVILLAFVIFYSYLTYSKNQSGTFGLITNRIDEDTRKGVENYFFSSMSPSDLIFGRGINGTYYCPGIDEVPGSVTVLRSVIETGYLQIVLKGGYLSLSLYLLITVPAIIIGIFYSKNVLTKASAVWILLYTIFLYPTYVNTFSLTYIIIWISVGICYSKEIRGKSDEEIKSIIQTS
jgi:hypothetical protein